MMPPFRLPILAALLLTACSGGGGLPDVARLEEPAPIEARGASGPPDAAPGTCWGRDETPARLETITEEIIETPAELAADGSVLTPAITRNVSRQRIIEERREVWFETPCPDDLTPDTVASLQRALAVRGMYHGPVTGELDTATREAIRSYQSAQGLNSDVLSLDAARRLGLAPVEMPHRDSITD